MENEGARTPNLLSRAVVVILIIGLVVAGTLVVSARARAEDQQLSLHDDDDPKVPFLHKQEGSEGFHGFGRFRQGRSGEYDVLLAEALGITVDELRDAYAAASSAALDRAVAEGLLSEDQAELMKARSALKQAIDRDELLAEALGISADELQAARDEGQKLWTLLDDLGLDGEEFRQALQAAYESAVGQAVLDGVITQDQADQFLSGDRIFGGRPGLRFHRDGRFRFKDHPWHRAPETDSNQNSNTNV